MNLGTKEISIHPKLNLKVVKNKYDKTGSGYKKK